MAEPTPQQNIEMNAEDMYREDVFTDNRVGTIRQLVPVDSSGERDRSRTVQFFGSTQVLTPAGALPLNFAIEANNLAEAIEAFGDAADKALDRTMEELREMQREAASSIVVPGQGGSGGMDSSGGMGGLGGAGGPGGKIRMP